MKNTPINPMDKALADLIRISRITGNDSMLTQAASGNTSVKTDDGKFMFIKASGTALKDMNSKSGWRKMRIDKVLKIISDPKTISLSPLKREKVVLNRLLRACEDNTKNPQKPSIESHLHALLDKYVIHLHPNITGAYVHSRKGRQVIKDLFKKEKCPPLWVPYAPPGFLLAQKILVLIKKYENKFDQRPSIIFLAKHGLLISAKTANESLQILRKTINQCKSKLPKPKSSRIRPPSEIEIRKTAHAIHEAIFNVTGRRLPVHYIFHKTIADFLNHHDAVKLLSTPALGPEEIIYINGPPVWLENPCAEKTVERLKIFNKKPLAFVVKNIGLFIAANKTNLRFIKDITISTLAVRNWAAHFGGIYSLTTAEQNHIINCCLESSKK